jgi:hypothetical protein
MVSVSARNWCYYAEQLKSRESEIVDRQYSCRAAAPTQPLARFQRGYENQLAFKHSKYRIDLTETIFKANLTCRQRTLRLRVCMEPS